MADVTVKTEGTYKYKKLELAEVWGTIGAAYGERLPAGSLGVRSILNLQVTQIAGSSSAANVYEVKAPVTSPGSQNNVATFYVRQAGSVATTDKAGTKSADTVSLSFRALVR